jgi:hypothetical protein
MRRVESAVTQPDIPSFDEDSFSIKIDRLAQLRQDAPRKEALFAQMVVSGDQTAGI